MNPFFIMALQLDLDYAADLTPHEFERFASLIARDCGVAALK